MFGKGLLQEFGFGNSKPSPSVWTQPLEGMRVVSRIGGRKQLEVQTVAEDQFNVRSLAAAVVGMGNNSRLMMG